MSGAWSYLLTIIGIAGLWAAATRPWGWLIGVSVQPLWITYALTTHQYGFIFGSVAYGTVQYRNWRQATTPRTTA